MLSRSCYFRCFWSLYSAILCFAISIVSLVGYFLNGISLWIYLTLFLTHLVTFSTLNTCKSATQVVRSTCNSCLIQLIVEITHFNRQIIVWRKITRWMLIKTHYHQLLTSSHPTQESSWRSTNPMHKQGLQESRQFNLQQRRVGQRYAYANLSRCYIMVDCDRCHILLVFF